VKKYLIVIDSGLPQPERFTVEAEGIGDALDKGRERLAHCAPEAEVTCVKFKGEVSDAPMAQTAERLPCK